MKIIAENLKKFYLPTGNRNFQCVLESLIYYAYETYRCTMEEGHNFGIRSDPPRGGTLG